MAGGRVFATLASVKDGYGNLILTAELPDVFIPVAGGRETMGATHVVLD